MRYRLTGHRILGKRFKTAVGEIDIVAAKDRTVIFIEVKAHQSWRSSLDAVTPRGRKRMEAAGHIFMSRFPKLVEYGVRYDIATLSRWRMSVLKDAWREGD